MKSKYSECYLWISLFACRIVKIAVIPLLWTSLQTFHSNPLDFYFLSSWCVLCITRLLVSNQEDVWLVKICLVFCIFFSSSFNKKILLTKERCPTPFHRKLWEEVLCAFMIFAPRKMVCALSTAYVCNLHINRECWAIKYVCIWFFCIVHQLVYGSSNHLNLVAKP